MRLSKRLFAAIAAGVVVISTGLGGVAQASIVEKPTLPKTSAVKGYPPTPELNAKPKKAGEVTTQAACVHLVTIMLLRLIAIQVLQLLKLLKESLSLILI